jgi:DNA anti-recombination protein RmuC
VYDHVRALCNLGAKLDCATELQAERARHQAELKQLEARYKQDLAQVRAEHESREASARQQLDDTGRIHDELVAVRKELAESRTENETLYHKQLVPAQVRSFDTVSGMLWFAVPMPQSCTRLFDFSAHSRNTQDACVSAA